MKTIFTLMILFSLPAAAQDGKAYRALPQVKKGGTLRMVLPANPASLNPLLNFNNEVASVIDMLFAPLMKPDTIDGGYFSYLASSVEISKDRKTYTYNLSDHATWSDGSPITADDAEYTFNTMMNKSVDAALKRSTFEGFHFKKISPKKFSLETQKPNVNTYSDINDQFRIIQKKQFSSETDFNKSKGLLYPVTSGPYTVKSFNPNESLILVRNKTWWAAANPELKSLYNFDELKFRIISDSQLAYEKLIKGDIDILTMNAETYGSKVKGIDKGYFSADSSNKEDLWASHFRSENNPTITFLNWNEDKEIFKSKATRQALAQLIDYDGIIKKVYFNEADRSFSPYGSQTKNTLPDLKKNHFNFDQSKALKLLFADGWKDQDDSGLLSKTINGAKVYFEFTLLFNSENLLRGKIAQIIQEDFKKAGITVRVQSLEYNTMIERISKHDFDAVVFSWGRGSVNADGESLWASKSSNDGFNFGRYSNPAVDKLMEEASKELEIRRHFKINQKISKIVYDDQPSAFILEVPGVFAAFRRSVVSSPSWFSKYDFDLPIELYRSK